MGKLVSLLLVLSFVSTIISLHPRDEDKSGRETENRMIIAIHPCDEDNSKRETINKMIVKLNEYSGKYSTVIISNISYTIIQPANTTIFIDSGVPKTDNGYEEYWILKNPAITPYKHFIPYNCSYVYLARGRDGRYQSTIRSDTQITLLKKNTNDSIYCYYDSPQGCEVFLYCGTTPKSIESVLTSTLIIENPDLNAQKEKQLMYSNAKSFNCDILTAFACMLFVALYNK